MKHIPLEPFGVEQLEDAPDDEGAAWASDIGREHTEEELYAASVWARKAHLPPWRRCSNCKFRTDERCTSTADYAPWERWMLQGGRYCYAWQRAKP